MVKPHTQNSISFRLEYALFGILIALVVFGVAVLVVPLGYQIWYAGRVYPGVQVAGIPIGGLSIAKAEEKLTTTLTYPQSGRLVLQDGANSWLVKPAQLGILLDAGSSARAAFQIGRNGGFFNRLEIQLAARRNAINLSPVLVFDQRMTFLFLNQIAGEIDSPLLEPQIQITGTEVNITPGSVGRSLDYSQSLERISAQVAGLQDGIVPLVVQTTNPVILNVEEQAQLARNLLSAPLTLTMPAGQTDSQGPWTFTPETLGQMLAFEVVQMNGTSQYQVTVQSEMLRDFLLRLQPDISLVPENTRFIFNDETRQLEVIKNAAIGRQLNIEESIKQYSQPAGCRCA